jgi:hypothetical protein
MKFIRINLKVNREDKKILNMSSHPLAAGILNQMSGILFILDPILMNKEELGLIFYPYPKTASLSFLQSGQLG